MELVVLPPPSEPSLTVRSLAKVMLLPAWAQSGELRDQKFPRAGGGKQRVPYYQTALLAMKAFIESGGDSQMLARANAELEGRLKAAEDESEPNHQVIAKLKHNLRLLEHAPGFSRLREATSGTAAGTRKLKFGGVEIRSTPDLLVHVRGASRYVFIHARDEACDDDEARRTLELAHWVEQEAGSATAVAADFEYWVLSENRVLSWKTARKTTVNRAKQTLPILVGAWERVEPPKAWRPAEAVSESEG